MARCVSMCMRESVRKLPCKLFIVVASLGIGVGGGQVGVSLYMSTDTAVWFAMYR